MTSGSFSILPVALERVVTAAANTVAFAEADEALLKDKKLNGEKTTISDSFKARERSKNKRIKLMKANTSSKEIAFLDLKICSVEKIYNVKILNHLINLHNLKNKITKL